MFDHFLASSQESIDQVYFSSCQSVKSINEDGMTWSETPTIIIDF